MYVEPITSDKVDYSRDVGLKQSITSDGVWRIRRLENSPVIEILRYEETGHGDILHPDFIQWRSGESSSIRTQAWRKV
jgi:hypothetical protein